MIGMPSAIAVSRMTRAMLSAPATTMRGRGHSSGS